MGLNIFNIWENIGRKVPFAVRRTHWANKGIYVIVDKVEGAEALKPLSSLNLSNT